MKPNKYIIGLLGVMGVCAILSWVTTGTAKAWFEGISTLVQPVFLFVVLVSMVAERRASEAKRKTETGV
jgi:hypothetical protein